MEAGQAGVSMGATDISRVEGILREERSRSKLFELAEVRDIPNSD